MYLLSPNQEKLDNLYKTYKKQIDSTNLSSSDYCKDSKETIEELSNNKVNKSADSSVANGSSIAFILTYQEKKFLFLGDADIKTINQSLVNLNFSTEKRLKVEFVKLSHHGSKQNINEKFLDLIDCSKFIVLTDCSNFAHPDKETLALIAMYNRKKRKDVDLVFNYSELIRKKISAEEELKYNFRAYSFEDNIWEVE